MDRQAFEYLYLHANSIATLGFLRGMVRMMSAPPAEEGGPELAEFVAGIEQQQQSPETFDWSVYDGIDDDVDALGRQQKEALASGLPFFTQLVDMVDESDAEGEMPDVDRFLSRALAAREALSPRIDDSLAKVDVAALEAALAKLPADLPPLTGALSAKDLERWVELYEANHEGLQQVVEETRKPEPVL